MDGSLLKSRGFFYPAITFPYLAALSPPDIDISMKHEIFEEIDFDEKIDLVGLTSVTNNVFRAYEIADEYRKRKVPVAMGGFHVSAEPEEAAEHADFVFIGEAEETWPQFLEDFKNGIPRKFYKAGNPPSLKGLPVPDYRIVNKKNYMGYEKKGLYRHWLKPLIPVQTARGCSLSCDFCDISHFHKGTYRTRPVPEVVREIQTLRAKFVCFVDDNIFADFRRSKELFKALIPLKITWLGQGTISAAADKELIRLAQRSGCVGLLVGLEAISQQSLISVGKKNNKVKGFDNNLRAFKKAGIDIDASMTFGFDADEPSVFRDTFTFLMKNRVPFAGLQPLRPSPGTPLYYKLKAQNRLKEDKWWLNRDSVASIFELKFSSTNMENEKFSENLFAMYRNFYSYGSIIRRFLLPPQRRFLLKIFMTIKLRKKISQQAFISEY